MNKLKYIIAREYTTRVRKRAFLIMTILGPILFGAIMMASVWLENAEDQEIKKIMVVELDNSQKPVPDSLLLFKNVIKNSSLLQFDYLGNMPVNQAENLLKNSNYFGLLIIRHSIIIASNKVSTELIAKKTPSSGIRIHIERALESYLYNRKLLTYNIPPQLIKSLQTDVELDIRKINADGGQDSELAGLKSSVSILLGFIIHFFIFFFSAQVMRGVAEEKSNRIVEVIITSVKPFQLMMGKIIGIGLVGLTQFVIWIVLIFTLFQFSEGYVKKERLATVQTEQQPVNLFDSSPVKTIPQSHSPILDETNLSILIDKFHQIDFTLIIAVFLFYFIGGYLLYSAMFAAVGAAIDNETETQQFILPVTIPLIVSLLVMTNVINNPDGQIAYWFSIIPFTSPVVMMARIGFGIPVSQIIISGILLIITFVGMTWVAAKVYRTGILMYGKKITYREIWKWLKYK